MTQGATILLDSDAFIGLLVATDAHHQRVEDILKKIDVQQGYLATTNLVIAETATGLSRRQQQVTAQRFIEYIRQSNFHVFYVNEAIQAATEDLFLEQKNNATSMVDCANVIITQMFEIPYILSFDHFYEKFAHFHMLG